MKAVRISLEDEYSVDMITHNGFVIGKDSKTSYNTNINDMINTSEYTDTEYRCNCGAFIGQDVVGEICPHCNSEIHLRALNFKYTGWIDLEDHKVITPTYYTILKRVLGNNMLRFILGDYKCDNTVQYDETDTEYIDNKKSKKSGRVSQNDINYIIKKIPKSKHIYQGIGHDEFYKNFETVMRDCSSSKNSEDVEQLIREKDKIFSSKIPFYSTAFRPVSTTSETMFYPKINKHFSTIASIASRLIDMYLDIEKIQALNYIQAYWCQASDDLINGEISAKTGLIRSEIIGGTFSYSARGVITLDNSLRSDELDLPFASVIIAFQYVITHRLALKYHMTLEQAYLQVAIKSHSPEVIEVLDDIIAEGRYVVMCREPVNNLASLGLFKIRSYKNDEDTISVSEEVLTGFNGDFDGDALNLMYLPPELVPYFELFHYSCFVNYVDNSISIDQKEWDYICDSQLTL